MPNSEISYARSGAVEAPASTKAVSAAVALGAIIAVAIGLRPSIVSVGPVLPSVIHEFGLSHAMASLLTSIPDLLMGLFALPTPWLARRFGRDPILLMALVLLAVSTLGRAFASSTAELLGTTAGVGIGIAIAGALVAGFIKARFPSKAAVLMGLYATALSLGSTVAAAVTGPVASNPAGGWRIASGMWSAVVLIGVIAWIVVARSERRHHAIVPVLPAHKLPMRSMKAWLVALFFACINLVFYSILAWTAPMFQELGLSSATAGFLLASFTAAFTAANPIFGWLSRSSDRRAWLAITAALTLIGLLAIAIAPLSAPFVWVPLCAFGLGGTFTLGMTLPLDNTHSEAQANAWNAFVLMVGYVIAAAGPLLMGQLRDVTGNFRVPYWLLVAVAVAMLALTPFLKPRPPALAASDE